MVKACTVPWQDSVCIALGSFVKIEGWDWLCVVLISKQYRGPFGREASKRERLWTLGSGLWTLGGLEALNLQCEDICHWDALDVVHALSCEFPCNEPEEGN
jgi:hypothetical protein